MYSICPKCKSKNVKDIETQVGEVKCKCLNCEYEFKRPPTAEEQREFNG